MVFSTLGVNFGECNTLRTNTTAEVNSGGSIEEKSWGEIFKKEPKGK
jgi:hypothetical protein